MAKKVPISINEEYEKQIRSLGAIIGQDVNQYGWIPKTMRFAILYTLNSVNNIDKAIPDLPPAILDNFLATIKRMKEKKYKAENDKKAQKSTQKV